MHLRIVKFDFRILDEIDMDLFKLPTEYSLAHCVSEELKMETGFAIDFK